VPLGYRFADTSLRTGLAALDMISKISLDREETHLVPLVSLHAGLRCGSRC
jgi:hypothetical protein